MASIHGEVPDRERERQLFEILADYFEAVESGQAPDRQQWLARYPDLAEEINDFLDDQDRLLKLTEPLRPIAEAAASEDSASTLAPTLREVAEGLVPDRRPETQPANGSACCPTTAKVRYIGDYELIEEIARGGMGVIFRARQRSLNRLVALKMLRAGTLMTDEDEQRFRQEAEAAANLDHPNIVPIFEVGRHDGYSYFSMKLVDGGSLAQRLRDFTTDQRASARLMAMVARAVHHAHQRGVLHRDLKPSNILLSGGPETPIGQFEPHVTDFGLAKRVEGDSELTQSGAILGTPSYMAPEQASGKKGVITVAIDVYGLGAIFYTILSGKPPFQGESAMETIAQVKDRVLDPPSSHGRRIDRDLETVCLKCLEKEPGRRYRSAEAVAEDLERWLRSEPIAARPAGRFERSSRWAWRNRVRVGAALAGLLTIALLGVATWKELDLRKARGLDELKSRELQRRSRDTRQVQYVASIRLAAQLLGDGRAAEASDVLDRQARLPGGEELRSFAESHLRTLLHREVATLTGHQGEVYHVDFSPDGRTLATAGQDGTARLWDVATRKPGATLKGHTDEVNWVVWSPDGRTLATASDDRSIRIWDARDGSPRGEVGRHDREAVAVLFTPDGRSLISGGRDKRISRWDVATRRETARWESPVGDIEWLARGHQGTSLLTAGHYAFAYQMDWTNGRILNWLDGSYGSSTGASPRINAGAVSGDGRLVAVTSALGGRVTLLDTDGRQLAVLVGHRDGVYAVAFAPGDRMLVTGGEDGTIRLWDVPSGTPRDLLSGHTNRVWSVAFSLNGRMFASESRDGTVKLWDTLRRPDRTVLSVSDDRLTSLAFSADGVRLLAVGKRGTVWSWDVATAEPGRPLQVARQSTIGQALLAPPGKTHALLAPDGRVLALWLDPQSLALYDLASGRPPIHLKVSEDWGGQLAFSGDGARLAIPEREAIHVWDVSTGHEVARFSSPQGPISGWPIFSPGRDILLFGNSVHWHNRSQSEDHDWLAAWKIASRRMLWLRNPYPDPHCLAWSPDGKTLVVSAHQSIVLRDATSVAERAVLVGHADDVNAAAFSPDSRTLASASQDRTVRLWDMATGQESLTLRGHAGPVIALCFAPDGTSLASLGVAPDGSSEIILWRTARPDPH